MAGTKPTDPRQRFYTLLQVGKAQLGMGEDDYRAFLAGQGATAQAGRVSATTLSVPQLAAAVEAMRALGFEPVSRRGSVARIGDWRRARVKKITALWCALADAGVVRDRSEAAMVKWCSGVTRVARLEWANSAQLNLCIEGLKRWADRERVKLDG